VEHDFIEPIWGSRWESVFSTFHADLSSLVERPVFIARMNLFKSHLGHCLGSGYFNANKIISYQSGHKISTDAKSLTFEKGKAKLDLKHLDGKLIGFTIETQPSPTGSLFIVPTTYYDRAHAFWEQFMTFDRPCTEVYTLLSEELRASLHLDAFEKMRGEFHKPGTGKLVAVKLAPSVDPAAPAEAKQGNSGTWELVAQFHVSQEVDASVREGGVRTFPATVTWAVNGWRMALLGFQASTNRSV